MSEEQKDTSPPAFPLGKQDYPNDEFEYSNPGMSLRDYFAGQALAGICGNSGGPIQANGHSGWGLVNCDEDHIAGLALAIADAMIKAREPEPKDAIRDKKNG